MRGFQTPPLSCNKQGMETIFFFPTHLLARLHIKIWYIEIYEAASDIHVHGRTGNGLVRKWDQLVILSVYGQWKQ